MSANDDRFKVVFLTDTRNWSSEKNDNKSLQLCTASVRLSVLKLLTYFANGTAGQATHLRWGYKFFNSIDIPPCKRETLKEFTENNVDTFEDQLLQEFQVGINLQKGSKTLSKSEEKKTVMKTGGIGPCMHLLMSCKIFSGRGRTFGLLSSQLMQMELQKGPEIEQQMLLQDLRTIFPIPRSIILSSFSCQFRNIHQMLSNSLALKRRSTRYSQHKRSKISSCHQMRMEG